MSLLDTASLVVTPNGTKAGKLYSVVPSSGAGDLSVTRATTATRVNSAGLIESVASNVPRLDYTNGSCPSILVEPQRTNILTYSEDFTNGWYAYLGSITATANYGISPNGTNTSTRVLFTSTNQIWAKLITGLTGLNGTFSLYIKGVAGKKIAINYGGTDNLVTLGNGWNKFTVSATGSIDFVFINTFGADTFDVEVWGGQVEAGSYATSYIPTTSASVTRNADVISKTGISSLIGQSEGVWYLDLYASGKDKDGANYATWLIAGDSPSNFQLYNIGTTLYWYVINTGSIVINQTANQTIVEGERYKIAIAYKSGDYALYINGVQKRTSTGSGVPAVSQFNLSAEGVGVSQAIVKNEYNTVALWKTRLTNTQLAQLTTI
jgi:hypothetical protein